MKGCIFQVMYQSFVCPVPLGAGDAREIAGLKCRDLTYDVSPQCRGCAGVLISHLNVMRITKNSLCICTSSFCPCQDSIFDILTCQILNLKTLTGLCSRVCQFELLKDFQTPGRFTMVWH